MQSDKKEMLDRIRGDLQYLCAISDRLNQALDAVEKDRAKFTDIAVLSEVNKWYNDFSNDYRELLDIIGIGTSNQKK